MNLKPLNDALLVKLDEDQWMFIDKPELIELPEEHIGAFKKRSQWGTVISWGSRCKARYHEGQKVYFRWADHRPGFKDSTGDFRFVREQELIAEDESDRP